MRAVEVTEFGGPEVLRLGTASDPVAGTGQVVVDVTVAEVLMMDTMIRRGLGRPYFPIEPPYAPGSGVAGVVTSVGVDVTTDWVGQRVVVELGGGGYAEKAVASADELIPVPDGLELPDAMALLHDGATAWGLLELTPVSAGQTVLVQPAAGGLGTVLVQLLAARDVRVVAVARGARKLALAKELGADTVVDYGEPGWEKRVGAVDVAFDGVGGELGRAAFSRVRDGGQFFNYGNASGSPTDVPRDGGVTVRGLETLSGMHDDYRRRAVEVFAEAAAGRIRAVIGETYPLEQVAEAHSALESRASFGKLLLVP